MSLAKFGCWALFCGVLSVGAVAGGLPQPPENGRIPFPGWQALAETGAVSRLIKPMSGALRPKWQSDGYLLLPINFASTPNARVGWDITLSADLRQAKGVEFDFFCRDPKYLTGISIYFHSGDGWYTSSFPLQKQAGWQRVTVTKADSRIEGRVAGWGTIETVRIAGWRCRDLDTECAIANFGPLAIKPKAVVLRAETHTLKKGGNSDSITKFAANVCETLDDIGLDTVMQSDIDLKAENLAGVPLVFLPYNPTLPEKCLQILEQYVAVGGKIIGFYSIPEEVKALLGLRNITWISDSDSMFSGLSKTEQGLAAQPEFVPEASGHAALVDTTGTHDLRIAAVWRDRAGQDTEHAALTITPTGALFGRLWHHGVSVEHAAILRAAATSLAPSLWRSTAKTAFERIGVCGGAEDFTQFLALFEKTKTSAEVQQALRQAKDARAEAKSLLDQGSWQDSVESSSRASLATRRAWFLSRPSRIGEFRGFWCHSAFGVRGKTWEQAIGFLKTNNFNAVFPNMLNAGITYYPSEVLSAYDGLSKQGDQLAQCLDACKKYDVQCHVWKTNWRIGQKASKDFYKRIVSEGRVQKHLNGQIKERWLCPSHPLNQQLEIDSMLEIVRKYEVDGLHFDYMRYAEDSFCYCEGCRSRFEKKLGCKVSDWPADTQKSGPLREAWLDFRRTSLDTVVECVAAQARAIRPGVRISAAVFRDGSQDRDSVGQDWLKWCERGWLDFVCPMNYTDSHETFYNMVASQRETVVNAILYSGIGLTCWRDPADAMKMAEQIGIVRELRLPGFVVFDYTPDADNVLPLLRLGTTAE